MLIWSFSHQRVLHLGILTDWSDSCAIEAFQIVTWWFLYHLVWISPYIAIFSFWVIQSGSWSTRHRNLDWCQVSELSLFILVWTGSLRLIYSFGVDLVSTLQTNSKYLLSCNQTLLKMNQVVFLTLIYLLYLCWRVLIMF